MVTFAFNEDNAMGAQAQINAQADMDCCLGDLSVQGPWIGKIIYLYFLVCLRKSPS